MFSVGNLKSNSRKVYPRVLPTAIEDITVEDRFTRVEMGEGEKIATYEAMKGVNTILVLRYENISLEEASVLSDFYMLSQGGYSSFILPTQIWRHRALKSVLNNLLSTFEWVFEEPITLSMERDNRCNVKVVLRAVYKPKTLENWITQPRYSIVEGNTLRTYQGNTDLVLMAQYDVGELSPESAKKVQIGLSQIKKELEGHYAYPGLIPVQVVNPETDLVKLVSKHNPLNHERRDSLIILLLAYENTSIASSGYTVGNPASTYYALFKRLSETYELLRIYVLPMKKFDVGGAETVESMQIRDFWQNLIQGGEESYNKVGFRFVNTPWIDLDDFTDKLPEIVTKVRDLFDPYFI